MTEKIEIFSSARGALKGQNMQRSSQPPNDLIDCSNFVIDFAGRKFINIGLDASDVFNVTVQIITPSRHVCITSVFLHRIFSLMPYIFTNITGPLINRRERLFLKDEFNTPYKTTYRGESMLAVESHQQQGCRVLLSGRDLLRLYELQWAISESISCKSNVTRCAVMVQLDQIATYLSSNVYVDKSSTIEEISTATSNIHHDLHALNIFPNSENSFINQIKLVANKQLAMCWASNIQNNGIDYIPSNDGAADIEEVIITRYYNIILFFPNKSYEKELKEKWIKAVNRIEKNEKLWIPNRYSEICSAHFIGNNRSSDQRSPSYVPSLFPQLYKRKICDATQQESLYHRILKRQKNICDSAVLNPNDTNECSTSQTSQVHTNNIFSTCDISTQVGFEVINTNQFVFECSFFDKNNVSTQIISQHTISSNKFQDKFIMKADKSCGPESINTSSCLSCDKFHGYYSIKNENALKDLTGTTFKVFDLLCSMIPKIF
ncbi:uncharacterized protein LOC111026341 [Myzus persicae]|uniref:uncharacterized protein LOC111026341 n=1 Tax=Myzus persicae TaxID=13164 RepID=UPI000B932F3D|nr:uncharacterized protein LOC111026341 [Myzus persicae]